MSRSDTIVLFDIDGTLTRPRLGVEQNMLDTLARLRKKVTIGLVGGSDFVKAKEQMGDTILENFDFVFSENGLIAFADAKPLAATSIKDHFGEDNLKKLINFLLRYIADLDIPIKRGTFIEFRTGMLNVSPIGRNCSQQERIEFEKYDKEHKIRETMIAAVQANFPELKLTMSIGGQISFDVFPEGWDKSYCLRHLNGAYKTIHFFGDKTYKGGNDYEIFVHPDVIGHTTTGPDSTIAQLAELFGN